MEKLKIAILQYKDFSPDMFNVRVLYIFLTMLLSSCALPRSTGTLEEIVGKRLASDTPVERIDVNSIQQAQAVNAKLATVVSRWPDNKKYVHAIAPGDLITITLWDTSSSSLYVSAGQKTSVLSPIKVLEDGYIALPYLDRVIVAGLGLNEAEAKIQREMEKAASTVRVHIEVSSGKKNSYSILGSVKAPGNYKIHTSPITLKEAFALAGGWNDELSLVQVFLERSGRNYRISAKQILNDPKLNINVLPGDFIRVEEDQRKIEVMGGKGAKNLISFDTEKFSIRRAISLSGGLVDVKSNPEGIILLRQLAPPLINSEIGKNLKAFVFDFTNAESLFAADTFLLADGDLIVLTESPVPATKSLLSLVAVGLGILNVK